jgi:hypothetical protein
MLCRAVHAVPCMPGKNTTDSRRPAALQSPGPQRSMRPAGILPIPRLCLAPQDRLAQQQQQAAAAGAGGRSAAAARTWLVEGIIVKVMSKALSEHGYYKKKGAVRRVRDKFVGEIELLDSGEGQRILSPPLFLRFTLVFVTSDEARICFAWRCPCSHSW